MDFIADGRKPLRILQLIVSTADGRYRYKIVQSIDFIVDECYRYKTSLLQILTILPSRRLSQLDANAKRLHFFSTLPLSRVAAMVAGASVAIIQGNTETYVALHFVSQIFRYIKLILISFNCRWHKTHKSETWLKKKQALLHCLHIYIILAFGCSEGLSYQI